MSLEHIVHRLGYEDMCPKAYCTCVTGHTSPSGMIQGCLAQTQATRLQQALRACHKGQSSRALSEISTTTNQRSTRPPAE